MNLNVVLLNARVLLSLARILLRPCRRRTRLLLYSPLVLYRDRSHLQRNVSHTTETLEWLWRLCNGGSVSNLLRPKSRLGRVVVELFEAPVACSPRQGIDGWRVVGRGAVGRVLAAE